MIDVRVAQVEDADALGEIHAASWAAAYAPFFAPEFARRNIEDRRHGRWPKRLADGLGSVLLAEVDGRPRALSWYLPSATRAGLGEINGFYGHPDGWGSGVAAALMAETLLRLRAAGFRRVHLWTVRDTPQSRRFYAKCGFTESGATRRYDFGEGNALDQVEYEREL
jgi:RimJ/RimL family protein N-acetyltransferase